MGGQLDKANAEKRAKLLDELRLRLSAADLDGETRGLFESVVAALEALAEGVDTAHCRITLRKAELEMLNHNMRELALSLRDVIAGVEEMETSLTSQVSRLAGAVEEQRRSNRRFYVGMSLVSALILGLCAYITLGTGDALEMLSGLTQALRLVDTII